MKTWFLAAAVLLAALGPAKAQEADECITDDQIVQKLKNVKEGEGKITLKGHSIYGHDIIVAQNTKARTYIVMGKGDDGCWISLDAGFVSEPDTGGRNG